MSSSPSPHPAASRQVGTLTERVLKLLAVTTVKPGPISIGQGNIDHMQIDHDYAYKHYFAAIPDIIIEPDYVGLHPEDGSIQFVKLMGDRISPDIVLLAVRPTKQGVLFARSLYILTQHKLDQYLSSGQAIRYV